MVRIPVYVGAGKLDLWEGSPLHQESAQNPRLERVAQHGGRNAYVEPTRKQGHDITLISVHSNVICASGTVPKPWIDHVDGVFRTG